MVSLYGDPQGEKVFSKSVASQSHVIGANKQQCSSDDQAIESLQTRVKELELALSKHENTQTLNVEPMSKNTSKVSFSQDRNGQMEQKCLPSNGTVKNKTAEDDDEHATYEL